MTEKANLRTVREAAAFLGWSYSKTYRHVKNGWLPRLRIGKRDYVPDLEQWQATNTVTPDAPPPTPVAVEVVPNPIADLMPRERRFGAKPKGRRPAA